MFLRRRRQRLALTAADAQPRPTRSRCPEARPPPPVSMVDLPYTPELAPRLQISDAWPMPTDEDRASASIRYEGEARRLTIRRPRFDRDGLYLFGRRYAAQTVTIEGAELKAMARGRTIAVDVSNQYILYLRLDLASVEPAVMPAEAHGCSQIPQLEDPERRPSERVRALAARVRVNADRRMGYTTPDWIVRLAHGSDDSTDDQDA